MMLKAILVDDDTSPFWCITTYMMMLDLTASLDELQNVEVEYLTLPGWKTCTSEIRTFEDLPEAAKKYVLKIEELCRIPGNLSIGSFVRASVLAHL